MLTLSYAIRRLRKSATSPANRSSNFRDPSANVDAMAGAVYEIEAEELRLTAEAVAVRLEERWLRSTDLVMVDGHWTTLAESQPFSELAAPMARRERLIQGARDAAILFGFLGLWLLIVFLRVYLRSPR